MALRAQSTFLYGFQVQMSNAAIDFKNASGGPVISATVPDGFYSLATLATAIAGAMNTADPANIYTVTVNRNVAGGTQNRVTISTNGIFLSLLFASGPRTASTIAPLIGFPVADQTGSTSYTGTSSAGTILVTAYPAYTYLPTTMEQLIYGNVNVSANGTKEVVVFQIQQFWSGEFKHEPEAKVITQWEPLYQWMIQGRLFDFTPEITSPTVFYTGTLEKTSRDGKALGFIWKEELSDIGPFFYTTGPLQFRLNPT